ncbi:hypothetical protein H0V99_02260 [Candidatus Saccharibacteria bacterium]|nr:hypothetical protein [Candidatus Saccharibacteria bacterium]
MTNKNIRATDDYEDELKLAKELFFKACKLGFETNKLTVGLIQRRLQITYMMAMFLLNEIERRNIAARVGDTYIFRMCVKSIEDCKW